MSNTHAHVPWWVRLADPSATVEAHDHRDGVCDLVSAEEFFADVKAGRRAMWEPGRCRLEVVWWKTGPSCGCRMCTDQVGRKLARRSERYATRRLLAAGRYDEV